MGPQKGILRLAKGVCLELHGIGNRALRGEHRTQLKRFEGVSDVIRCHVRIASWLAKAHPQNALTGFLLLQHVIRRTQTRRFIKKNPTF